MIRELWVNREKPPLFSREWVRAWVKRVLLSRHFLGQALAHTRLRRQGAQIAGSAFFSNVRMIEGSALSKLVVGEETFVGRVDIAAHEAVLIGRRVCINDGVRILTASHDVEDPLWRSFARPVVIKDYAWIAMDAILLPGVVIGSGAVVGAGAVVSRDVPNNAVVAGNPAVVLKKQRSAGLDYSPVGSLALHNAWLGPPRAKADLANKSAA